MRSATVVVAACASYVRRSRTRRCSVTREVHPVASSIAAERAAPIGAGDLPVDAAVGDDLRALHAVVEGTVRGTGQEFFQSLVRHLAQAIDVHYAVVAEFPKAPPHVRTLAFWERDH